MIVTALIRLESNDQFVSFGPRLQSEEDMIENTVNRDKESRDEPSSDQEKNDEAKHAHSVVELNGFIWQKVAQNMASVQRRQRDQIENEKE